MDIHSKPHSNNYWIKRRKRIPKYDRGTKVSNDCIWFVVLSCMTYIYLLDNSEVKARSLNLCNYITLLLL